ncbi:hypothetical protein TNCT_127561 [Trichonephila clavata]|uniref:Uncharacterized protein n=1 Tax=Trichonephila clavata TaxID=2740835 RepID=A0A8X6HQM1_TRICU|nr:hypothetical protein TNCT_127561 [Trichonephila clavata]
MYNSAGGAKSNMNYRIALVEQIVEQNKPNVQLPGPGWPSVNLLRVTGRHFPEHIAPTEKNLLRPDSVLYAVVKPMKKGRG